MDTDTRCEGPTDARYIAFLETIVQLRPRLHRFCARMTGSVMDGEDVVQEALFQAFRKLESFDDTKPLAPWVFQIAHNRCIDFLRRRGVREAAEAAVAVPDVDVPAEPARAAIGPAVEHLVLALPPKERACVLLKDVFDYSLDEIAELVDSTVGGVKAALHRGRSKLAATPRSAAPARDEDERLLRLYVERFNQQDWSGLRELIAADARLTVADRYFGPVTGSPYFSNYARLSRPWRLAPARVDGAAAIVILRRGEDVWSPDAIVRLTFDDGRIASITDYCHCPWVVPAADSIELL